MEQFLLICGILSGFGVVCLAVYKWVVVPIKQRFESYEELIKAMDERCTMADEMIKDLTEQKEELWSSLQKLMKAEDDEARDSKSS